MLSSELAERIHALFLAMPPEGPLHDALERFTAVYREALPKGGAPFQRANAPDIAVAFGPWQAAISPVLDVLKALVPSAILVALGKVEQATRAFLSEHSSMPALTTLVADLEEFRSRYDEVVATDARIGIVLPLLAAADRLSRSLAATRDALGVVETELTPPDVEPPPGYERLTLILYSEMSFSDLVAKLSALASISTVRGKTNIAGLGRRNHAKPRRSDFPPNQGIGVG